MNDQYEDRKSSKSQSLKQQRAIARARSMGLTESYRPSAPTQKVFNMRWICDTLDQVLMELDAYAGREPEIGSAVEMIESAKRVITSYGSRVLDTPYKNYSNRPKPAQRGWSRKGNYDDFADSGGFDDAAYLSAGLFIDIDGDTDIDLVGRKFRLGQPAAIGKAVEIIARLDAAIHGGGINAETANGGGIGRQRRMSQHQQAGGKQHHTHFIILQLAWRVC